METENPSDPNIWNIIDLPCTIIQSDKNAEDNLKISNHSIQFEQKLFELQQENEVLRYKIARLQEEKLTAFPLSKIILIQNEPETISYNSLIKPVFQILINSTERLIVQVLLDFQSNNKTKNLVRVFGLNSIVYDPSENRRLWRFPKLRICGPVGRYRFKIRATNYSAEILEQTFTQYFLLTKKEFNSDK